MSDQFCWGRRPERRRPAGIFSAQKREPRRARRTRSRRGAEISRIEAGFVRTAVLFLVSALSACSAPAPVAYSRPSPEERAARTAFVAAHPELPAALKRQLLDFEATPETALRRFEYVRTHSDLSAALRHLILTGDVRLHMKREHVRAAWGEPLRSETRGNSERWVYPAPSRSGREREIELYFRGDELTDLRK